jgi:hypothetical protein
MKYIKDLNKLYGPIKALDQMGAVDNMSYFEKSYNRLKKRLEALEIIKPLIELKKEKNGYWLWINLNGIQITEKQYNLLSEVFGK